MRNRTLHPSVIALAIALVSSLDAQQQVETVPKVFSRSHAPGARSLPFGRTRCLVQYWHRGDRITRGTIAELGWRVDQSTRASALSQRVRIRIGNVGRGFDELSATFDENFDRGATEFLSAKILNLPAVTKISEPNVPALWIKGDRPFVFAGPNLVVEVDVSTAPSPRSTGYWTDGFTMAEFETLHTTSGPSCGGRLVSDYDHSLARFRLALTGGEADRMAVFMIGTDTVSFASTPLPLDLTRYGMPGCWLGLAPVVFVTTIMDREGRANIDFPVRLPKDSVEVHGQVVHESPNNPAGMVTTNVTHTVLGHTGLGNVLYNWDVFSPTAQYGPYPTNRGTILLLRR